MEWIGLVSTAAAALYDRQDSKNKQEQVQQRNKQRDSQTNSIGHRIGQIFGSLHIVQNVSREDANTQN